MSLRWTSVNGSLELSHAQKGYEYRIRESDGGGVLLFQRRRDDGQDVQRVRCADRAAAYSLAERWAAGV